MKRICSFIVAAVACAPAVFAQPAPVAVPTGFVNAVGLSTATDFRIDGQSVKPAGFLEGAYATSFGVAPGSRQFSFSNPGCDPLSVTLEVKTGNSALHVLYKTSTRRTDGTIKNALKLMSVPQQAAPRGPQFFVFSTFEGRNVNLPINGSSMVVEPLKLTPIDGSSVELKGSGLKPLRVSPREPGNYILVLFESADSPMRWALVEMTQ
jgi:hypothetical protein